MKLLTQLAMLALMAAPIPAQTARVGTFHKPSVVVAFYPSPQWAETLKAKMAEMEEAKKANDSKKVEALENWGKAHQEQAHLQLTGEAPIANILEALAPAFLEIARKAQVSMIVADLPYSDTTVSTSPIWCWIGSRPTIGPGPSSARSGTIRVPCRRSIEAPVGRRAGRGPVLL
ncbi:MAG TPA: hypothetical protein VE959_06465 [Bryobacteraceae bacterium]|nr:hypothetical protein [Bryobacteraceae bacterium]